MNISFVHPSYVSLLLLKRHGTFTKLNVPTKMKRQMAEREKMRTDLKNITHVLITLTAPFSNISV